MHGKLLASRCTKNIFKGQLQQAPRSSTGPLVLAQEKLDLFESRHRPPLLHFSCHLQLSRCSPELQGRWFSTVLWLNKSSCTSLTRFTFRSQSLLMENACRDHSHSDQQSVHWLCSCAIVLLWGLWVLTLKGIVHPNVKIYIYSPLGFPNPYAVTLSVKCRSQHESTRTITQLVPGGKKERKVAHILLIHFIPNL